MQLITERLIIRKITIDDAPFIFNLYNQPSFIENIGDRGLHTLDDTREWIDSVFAHYHNFGYWLYIVALKDCGTCVGINGLVKRDYFDNPDVGFAFLPEHCRKGFAFESSLAVIEHAKVLKQNCLSQADSLLAITSPNNTASQQLLLKLGFTQQADFNIPNGDGDGDNGETEIVNTFSFAL